MASTVSAVARPLSTWSVLSRRSRALIAWSCVAEVDVSLHTVANAARSAATAATIALLVAPEASGARLAIDLRKAVFAAPTACPAVGPPTVCRARSVARVPPT